MEIEGLFEEVILLSPSYEKIPVFNKFLPKYLQIIIFAGMLSVV